VRSSAFGREIPHRGAPFRYLLEVPVAEAEKPCLGAGMREVPKGQARKRRLGLRHGLAR
jgi:hypothetical protein